MKTFVIHYEMGLINDAVTIKGDTIEEVQVKVEKFKTDHGLEEERNNMWSEEV
jgi:hypothetical protein